ncbi:MAG: DMT family transporter [Nitrososphaerota archaeon]
MELRFVNERFNKIVGVSFVSIAAVIWGSNGVIVNFIELDPFLIAYYRTLLATLLLIPTVFLVNKREFIKAVREWKLLIFNGFMNALGWGFLFSSMKLIPIAISVLLNYLAPIFVAILSPFFLKEKIKTTTIVSLPLSLLGVTLIFNEQINYGSASIPGIIYGLLSGLFYAVFILISKKIRREYSSYTLASYTYMFTLVFLAIIVSASSQTINVKEEAIPLLLLIGFVNTAFAVTIYFHGLGLIEAQKAVILTYFEPLCAALFGVLFLNQILSIPLIVGGILIILSGYIVARY